MELGNAPVDVLRHHRLDVGPVLNGHQLHVAGQAPCEGP